MNAPKQLNPYPILEAPKIWTKLFTENKLATRGRELSYIAPIIIEGEKVSQLQQEEVERETAHWKHALILYVLGNSPPIGAVQRFIASN